MLESDHVLSHSVSSVTAELYMIKWSLTKMKTPSIIINSYVMEGEESYEHSIGKYSHPCDTLLHF